MDGTVSRICEVDLHTFAVDRYADIAPAGALQRVRALAGDVVERIDGRVVWHVNSTAVGGGVAEMLPSLLGYCRGLGLSTRWLVISGEPAFFRITKRLHHALHGERGDGSALDEEARRVYERTLRENATELLALTRPGDIVILHDPQTLGLAPHLDSHGVRVIWRCHIGRSEPTDEARAAWDFLEPYLGHAVRYVFSRTEYVPEALDHGKSLVLPPSIDAFSPKNQDLTPVQVGTILAHCGILSGPMPAVPDLEFARADGSRGRVNRYADVIRCGPPTAGHAPLITQVSRWDPLKDPVGVMHGFARWLDRGPDNGAELVLAGPSVRSVPDDPESPDTFREVFAAWCDLPHAHRSRVHLVMLPMVDIEENAAIVNALQRHATIVVQKSLQEGFGLTVAEAMWKGRPVVASRVGGIQDQVTDGHDGMLLDVPSDLEQFSRLLGRLLEDDALARRLGAAGRETVRQRFLELRSVEDHLRLIGDYI